MLWRSRFHADRSLVGKSILLDGQNHQVVGIIPAPLPYHGNEHGVRDFRPLVLGLGELALMGNQLCAVIRGAA
jgi:hypothetical protein